MADINALKEYLVEKGVKPSYPRLKVLEYLMKHKNHPTAEEIYCELLDGMPTLSRTTIYNTLNLFVDESIVVPITINSNETRYDATVKDHGHFKCEACGKIVDFTIDIDKLCAPELNNYQISCKNLYLKGICPDCLYE
ncbi:MAG: transcriptional repressor [Clostridiaceae bacterium]|nr:transcriptional repressor [Clostridiaceae bacterium]